jgi:hypothetical protein
MEKYPEIASSFTTLMGSVIQDGKLASKEKELKPENRVRRFTRVTNISFF